MKGSTLSCAGLFFSYTNKGQPTINDFSAEFTAGRFYGILGANGCGKTTLLDLLIGSKKPQSGAVLLGGLSLAAIQKRERAKKISLIPQQHDSGFGYLAEEIVMMGRTPHIPRFASPAKEDWQAVENAMNELGITELRRRQITSLSGGQRQRVIAARAFAQQTEIMLFDEATANLDIRYALHILSLARKRVAAGGTAIAVLHDLNLAASFCDEILFMQEGRVRFSGKTPEVLTPACIRKIYGVESRVVFDDGLRVHFLCS